MPTQLKRPGHLRVTFEATEYLFYVSNIIDISSLIPLNNKKTVFRFSIDDIQNNSELHAITIEQNPIF